MGAMYRVCSLLLSPNFVVRLATGNNFYLRLIVQKIHAFVGFNDKYLRSSGSSNTNFTAKFYCRSARTEILSEIIETQIIGIK